MDWVKTLAREADAHPLARIRPVASKYRLTPSAVAAALIRQAKRGLLEKLADGVYLNRLAQAVTATDVFNDLVPDSYISLATALAEHGLIADPPSVLTCVSLPRARKIKSKSLQTIVYRKISKNLFWGYQERRGRFGKYRIAEPEKAVLDWIYFHLQDGQPVPLDQIQFSKLSRSKLVPYAKKFPSTVIRTLFWPMLEGEITGLQP